MEVSADDAARALARRRLEAKQDFISHLVAYVVVNVFMIGIWAFTGGGYFWPAWVMGSWGIGLALHAWEVYFKRPVTEDDVEAELHRIR